MVCARIHGSMQYWVKTAEAAQVILNQLGRSYSKKKRFPRRSHTSLLTELNCRWSRTRTSGPAGSRYRCSTVRSSVLKRTAELSAMVRSLHWDHFTFQHMHDGVRAGLRELGPHLIGLDPRELTKLNHRMDAALPLLHLNSTTDGLILIHTLMRFEIGGWASQLILGAGSGSAV